MESQIFAGESVQLFCTVSRGDLPISSAWLFNGERLPMSTSGLTTTQVGPRTLLLAIHTATAWNSGNYTCIAENSAGVTEHTVTLLVHGMTNHTQSHVHDIVKYWELYLQELGQFIFWFFYRELGTLSKFASLSF